MRKRRFRTWMMDNAYWVMIICTLGIVAGCAWYTQDLKQDVQAAAGAPEIMESMQPEMTPVLTPLPTIAPLAQRPAVLVERGGAWPVQGEILRAFDLQESVYWEKLGSWQTHHGLDIAAQAGASVGASMDGKVIDTARDALWACCVCIEHDDGSEMRYAGLESCAVREGERVRRGQTIGILMDKIPCEAEMDTHLHLEMLRSGRYQDPEAALAER